MVSRKQRIALAITACLMATQFDTKTVSAADTRFVFANDGYVLTTWIQVSNASLAGSGASQNAGTLTAFYYYSGVGTSTSLASMNNLQVTYSADKKTLTHVFDAPNSQYDYAIVSTGFLYQDISADQANIGSVGLGIDSTYNGSWNVANAAASAGNAVNFGRHLINQSVSSQISVSNSGDSYSLLSGQFNANSGPFAVTATPFTNVESGSSATATVTFTPTAIGVVSAFPTITTNAGNVSDSVSGRGIIKRSLQGATVELGNVLINASLSGTFTFTNNLPSGADPLNYTMPTLLKAGASDSLVTIGAAASDVVLNQASQSFSRSYSAKFSSAGTVHDDLTLAVSAEGNVGNEGTYSQGVRFNADVFNLGHVTTDTGTVKPTQSLRVMENSGLPNHTGALLNSITIAPITNGAFSLTGLTAGVSTITPGGETSGTVGFDKTNLLNGLHVTTTATLKFQSYIVGTGAPTGSVAGDLGSIDRTLEYTVTGNTAPVGPNGSFGTAQTAQVIAGTNLAGISSQTQAGGSTIGTVATILAGTSAAGGQISMSWRTQLSTEPKVISDVLNFSKPTGGIFVLELTYSPAKLLAARSLFPDNRDWPVLGWLNPLGQWVRAVDGNTAVGALATGAPEIGAFSDQGAAGLTDDLGRFGYDLTTHTVWAVLDHNSTFAALAAPEPSSLALLGIGAAALLRRRKA